MADPIATLSLASSILQVIDFASSFATTAWKIYQAADRGREALDEVEELRKIANDLADILQEIQSQPVSGAAAADSSDGIVSLAKACATLVEELLQTLPAGTNITRKRDAIRVAFKLKWKSENIRALQTRLAEFRSQLTLNLLFSMRQYASQSMSQQERIIRDLSGMNRKSNEFKAFDDNRERIGSSILEYVTSKLRPATQLEERHVLQRNINQAIQSSSVNDASAGSSSLNLSVSEKVQADSLKRLLASLSYRGMDDREWRIATAHHATFRWLFDENKETRKTNFKDWLSSEESLYWITGKAGSGKSTLMKYISYPSETRDNSDPLARCYEDLSKWSGDSRLVIASFYFWNSGEHIQTTQRGLMMTLLYQILKQCPGLASLAFPAQWETLCLFGNYTRDLGDRELRDSLRHAIANAQSCDAKIALFIDGLDEFEGKSEELIELLRDILHLPHLKVCVSSRPWTEFEDAFRSKPSLKVEDLTYDDIRKFVTSKFEEQPPFRDLRVEETPYADTLIESIVSRAQGVFLWVALVVSSLITGFSSGDRVSDLEKRLALLPPDLEGLYEKILRSLDPFYLEHAAQLFAMVAANQGPINVMIAAFADEEAPKFCLERRVQVMSEAEVQRCVDTMRRRINTRTRGLLEVKRNHDIEMQRPDEREFRVQYTVQYLHRTVKDYIESETTLAILHATTKSSFDPHLRLLAGLITYIKTQNADNITVHSMGFHLRQCMEYARNVAASSIPSMVVLLDELDKVISALWKRKATTTTNHRRATMEKGLWTLDFHPVELPRASKQGLFGYTFLSLAVAFNVVEYVRARAPLSCFVNKPYLDKETLAITYKPWPLITDIFYINIPITCKNEDGRRYTFPTSSTPPSQRRGQSSDTQMLDCLLAKGANPARVIFLEDILVRSIETSVFIEMVAHMMRNQTLAMTEAIRSLVQAIPVIDDGTLHQIILRFWTRIFGPMGTLNVNTSDLVMPFLPLPKGKLEKLKRIIFGNKSRHAHRSKGITYHLRLALDNICDVNKSSFRTDYGKVVNDMVPEFSIEQLVVASQLTASLTVGAKYYGPRPAAYLWRR
ncbi:hypothetical protein F5Y10DRAFT_287923 [Nemania abortiva]|nr:hypothetical protein F5Y10DRAFT_287923 [Nemania abortiva]